MKKLTQLWTALFALVAIAASAYTVPNQTDLLFGINTDTLPASGNTGNWTAYAPAAGVFNTLGTPTVSVKNGVQWEKNVSPNMGYYNAWTWTSPVAVNGVTATAVVKPVRAANLRNWTPIIDIMFGAFRLGVRNDTGVVILTRSTPAGTQTQVNSTAALADGASYVISAVVLADGSYNVYTNGGATPIMTGGALAGGVTSLVNGTRRLVCIGTSQDDQSACFNGSIGDVYMWKSVLADTDRQQLEASLMAKFHIDPVNNTPKTITATATTGATITPSGTTTVQYEADQTYAISGAYGYTLDVVVDGASQGNISSYTFSAVTANHTIAANATALPTRTISGKVTDSATSTNIPGATVSVKLTASSLPSQTATTDANGNYTMTVPEGVYYLCASHTGHLISADTLSNTAGDQTVDFALAIKSHLNGVARKIPQMENLLFAADANDMGAVGTSGNWPLLYTTFPATPALTQLTAMTTPLVTKVRGLKYDNNSRSDGDGYRLNAVSQNASLPVNGVTIVTLVKPTRNTTSDGWNSIVDIFYSNMKLAILNNTGQIRATRNGTDYISANDAAHTVPDGQITILSMVVQANGTLTVYGRAWNGTTKTFGAQTVLLTTTATSAFPAFVPAQGAPDDFRKWVNVGRNNPDGWTTFNGYIGDVFVYKTALSDTDRGTLESDLETKMNSIATYNITATAGPNGSVSPAGVTSVGETDSQTYTITPAWGYDVADVLVDGASVGAVTTYTFSNVTAAHTISATFVAKPTFAVTGKVVKASDSTPIAGAKVYVSTTANASVSPLYILTTDAGGNYSVNLFNNTWYLCASATGFTTSADASAVVSGAAAVLPDFALVASGKHIPQMDQLQFAVYSSSLTANGATTQPWPLDHPLGKTAEVMSGPAIANDGGIAWETNRYSGADGYRVGNYTAPIAVNGITATAVIQPGGNGVDGGNWTSIIDVMYSRFVLAIRGTTGELIVMRNGSRTDSGVLIPNGQKTIVTAVVQPDGQYQVFTNGVRVMNITTTSAMTTLDPTWNAGGLGFWSYINLGRNNPDGWTTYQGYLGAAMLWKTALTPLDRIAFESELGTQFGIIMPVYHNITATAGTGGTISPAGITPVLDGGNQDFVVMANIGYRISDVLVDGVSVGGAPYASPYTNSFTGVTAAHTISAAFAVVPQYTISGQVSDASGPVAGATVYFSTSPNAFVSPLATATTDASGNYSQSLYEANYYVSAGKTGYYNSADQTVNLTANTTGIDFTLVSNTRVIPSQSDIWFSAVTDTLPNSGAAGQWAAYLPASLPSFTPHGSPTVEILNGIKWEQNNLADADRFTVSGPDGASTPVNGATIVVAVRPLRTGTANNWQSVVDIYRDNLVLGVDQGGGKVIVRRNNNMTSSTGELPDGMPAVLSLVVQPDGTYVAYANGAPILVNTNSSPFAAFVPKQFGTEDWRSYVNIGCNNGDGWATFNGNIGDVFVYKKALSDLERNTLERDLGAKFGVVVPQAFLVSGKVTLQDGITPVAGVTVSAQGTGFFTTTSAADGTYSMALPQDFYYITGTKPGYVQDNGPFANTISGPVTYDITMKPANRVTGTVKDSSGNPIANAIVQVIGFDGTGPAAVTGADGNYLVVNVDPNLMGTPVSLYADALGYADNTISVDITSAGSSIITQDVVLTAKAETDYSYGQNGGFEIIDPATGKPAGWHEWSGTNMWNYNAGLGDQFIASTSVAGEFYSGTNGAKYTPLGTQQYCFLGQKVPVVEGSTYNLYWKMKADAGITSAFPFAEFRNATGDDVGQPIFIQYGGTYPTEWTQFPTDLTKGVRVTIPPGAVYISLLVGCIDPWGGKSVYVDDVVIDRVGPAAPILDVTLPVPTFVDGKATFDLTTSASGKTYTLQYKDDLSATSWTDLAGTATAAGTGAALQLQDPTSPLPGARFYRLSVQ